MLKTTRGTNRSKITMLLMFVCRLFLGKEMIVLLKILYFIPLKVFCISKTTRGTNRSKITKHMFFPSSRNCKEIIINTTSVGKGQI